MKKILCTGQGGQGVLSMGQMLTESAMYEGHFVTFLPSYGVEMRGGPASCGVTIAAQEIASPMCTTPDILICMSERAFHAHKMKVKEGGIILVNSSIVKDISNTQGIYQIPANDLAIEAGNIKASNMVMLGALIALTQLVQDINIYTCIENKFSKKQKVLEINKKAFQLGKTAVVI